MVFVVLGMSIEEQGRQPGANWIRVGWLRAEVEVGEGLSENRQVSVIVYSVMVCCSLQPGSVVSPSLVIDGVITRRKGARRRR